MVLRAKTDKSQSELEKKRMEIIKQGAPVTPDPQQETDWSNFCLRIKKSMSKEIDSILEECEGVTKTGFILQAIRDKIKKHHQEQG